MNGFTEVLTWILCSHKESFDLLNRTDDQSKAVIIGNPRSSDFEVCATYPCITRFFLVIFSPELLEWCHMCSSQF